MNRPLLALLALFLLLGPVLAQDDAEEEQGKEKGDLRRQVAAYHEDLLANRETINLGEMVVTVTLIPDTFMLLALENLLEVEDLNEREVDELKDRLARLARREGDMMGTPSLILRFHHKDAGSRNFYCFTGKFNDCIRARALGKVRLKAISSSGPQPVGRRYMLFKPHRSEAFGQGNVPPQLRKNLSVFGDEPFEVRFLVKKGFSDKADELEVSVGNLIHVSGSGGITADQIDFEHGATARYPQGETASFALPARGPELPAALVELLPEWQGD